MDNNVDKIIEAIKPLADKLGQGAEALFGIYTRQMVAEGVASIVMGLIGLIILIVGGWFVIKFLKDEEQDGEAQGTVFIVSIFASLLLILFSVSSLHDGILKTINPQFYAIERVVCQVKNCDE